MTQRKKTHIKYIAERILLAPFSLLAKISISRKERKLQFTGKTLINCGNTTVESYLSTVFLQLFHRNLEQGYDLTEKDAFLSLTKGCQKVVSAGDTFFKQVSFYRKNKYKTVIDLRPTPSILPAFAAYLGGVKFRVGFTVGSGNAFLNFNFPFNQFITHFTHQQKSLFESVTLQKIAEMPAPCYTIAEESQRAAYLTDNSSPYILLETDNDGTWPVIPTEKFLPFLQPDASMHKMLICSDERYAEIQATLGDRNDITRIQPESAADLMRICSGAAWYAGVNTLAAHFVAQQKKHTYVFFSSGNERLYQPFSVLSRAYTANVPCRPCARSWLPHECENEIPYICTNISVIDLAEKKPAVKPKKGRR